MYTALNFTQTGRVTNVVKVTSLSENYIPDGEFFSMFLAPKDDGVSSSGDVLIVEAMLPDSDGQYVDVPVVVGDWSPVFFRALKAGGIDLSDVDVYVAPIKEKTIG